MHSLLDPLQIKSTRLKNRLIMPPMATAKAKPDGKVSQALLDYYREKSAGGYFSLIIIEHSYIHQEGKASPNQLSIADDSVIEGLQELAKVIHENGSQCIIQMNHAGSATKEEITGVIPVGPSAVANPRLGSTPRELTPEEIENLVTAFADAARRAKTAGFDGVEIHSAHGYLLNQFFSPLTNRRSDQYGGTVEDRIRIHQKVIAAVRKSVGDDSMVLLRLGASDFMNGGSTIEDSQIAAQEFEKTGLDILDISGGFSGYNVPGLTYGPENQGYFASLTEAVKKVVSLPVILTGGIIEVQAAQKMLAEGKADLIGVGRAVFSDSDWARRAIESLRQG
ncbi:MAG TPA: NADH oxidase [Firmicutes bacterium]|jgi:NADPH2 dehydrogenase|nr:NADH oxidase [Bacillota bacterium]